MSINTSFTLCPGPNGAFQVLPKDARKRQTILFRAVGVVSFGRGQTKQFDRSGGTLVGGLGWGRSQSRPASTSADTRDELRIRSPFEPLVHLRNMDGGTVSPLSAQEYQVWKEKTGRCTKKAPGESFPTPTNQQRIDELRKRIREQSRQRNKIASSTTSYWAPKAVRVQPFEQLAHHRNLKDGILSPFLIDTYKTWNEDSIVTFGAPLEGAFGRSLCDLKRRVKIAEIARCDARKQLLDIMEDKRQVSIRLIHQKATVLELSTRDHEKNCMKTELDAATNEGKGMATVSTSAETALEALTTTDFPCGGEDNLDSDKAEYPTAVAGLHPAPSGEANGGEMTFLERSSISQNSIIENHQNPEPSRVDAGNSTMNESSTLSAEDTTPSQSINLHSSDVQKKDSFVNACRGTTFDCAESSASTLHLFGDSQSRDSVEQLNRSDPKMEMSSANRVAPQNPAQDQVQASPCCQERSRAAKSIKDSTQQSSADENVDEPISCAVDKTASLSPAVAFENFDILGDLELGTPSKGFRSSSESSANTYLILENDKLSLLNISAITTSPSNISIRDISTPEDIFGGFMGNEAALDVKEEDKAQESTIAREPKIDASSSCLNASPHRKKDNSYVQQLHSEAHTYKASEFDSYHHPKGQPSSSQDNSPAQEGESLNSLMVLSYSETRLALQDSTNDRPSTENSASTVKITNARAENDLPENYFAEPRDNNKDEKATNAPSSCDNNVRPTRVLRSRTIQTAKKEPVDATDDDPMETPLESNTSQASKTRGRRRRGTLAATMKAPAVKRRRTVR